MDHRFTRFLQHAALMAMGTIFLLGIAGKKAQADNLSCTITGNPAPTVHGSVPFYYQVDGNGYDGTNPYVQYVNIYSSANWKLVKGTAAFPYPTYIGEHTFNVANYADGEYMWDAQVFLFLFGPGPSSLPIYWYDSP